MPAYTITITGRVQGVFFRDFTQKVAESHDLTGWVRNDPEGTVTVFAQGEEEDLDSLTAKLWQGSEQSKVKDIEKTPAEEDSSVTMFEVRY